MHGLTRKAALALVAIAAVAGCAGEDGKDGTNGTNGTNGVSCTSVDSGTVLTVTCPDGVYTVADGTNGTNGTNGTSCTMVDNLDGTATITCGTTVATVGTGKIIQAETCSYCHQAASPVADPTPFHDAAAVNAIVRGAINITSADFTADGSGFVKPTITFQVFDRSGSLVEDWGAFNFTVAQLVPATDEVPEYWAPFVWGTRTGFANGVPSREIGGAMVTGTPKGTLSYDFGTQEYTYTFATDITGTETALNALAPAYDSAATLRIGIQLTTYSAPNVTPAYDMANGVNDFVPDSSTAPVPLAREIVTTDACNACHGKLAIHGRRVEVNYCTTCHNPTLVSDLGVSGDLGVYIHRIHGRDVISPALAATSLLGVIPAEITYPQNIVHCDTCHQGAGGARWNTNPSRYACTSCHDTISFVDPAPVGMTLHTGGACTADVLGCESGTSSCTDCHDAATNLASHTLPAEAEATKLEPEIGAVAYTSATGNVSIQFRVVDPTNGDAPYALTDPYFTQTGGASTLTALVGFRNTDYTNQGITGTTFGQPLNVNLLVPPANTTITGPDGSGWYTAVVAAGLPTGLTGQATVAIQGHPAFDHDSNAATAALRIPMTNVSKAFNLSGTTSPVPARRAAVNIAKCNACHFNLSLHGNNRTGDITTCAICHNTEATDGSRRPNFTTPGTLGVDGKLEEGIDLKYMIHSIHGTGAGAAITVYGFGGSVNDFAEVTYPMALANCQACHVPGGYQAPAATARGTSTYAGADRAAYTDNLRITKYKATCGVCHTNGVAQSHMQQMGSTTDVTQPQIDAVNQ
jgi:OmcA/MtrC family decaheme c-type cytochrome